MVFARRDQGNPLQAGERFDPYNKILSGSAYRLPLAPDHYTGDISADSYGSSSQTLASSASGSGSFAYASNPAAFDQFTKNPVHQQEVNISNKKEVYSERNVSKFDDLFIAVDLEHI